MSLIDESHPTHDGGPAVGGSAVGIDALLGAAGNENNRFLRELEKIDGGASGRLVLVGELQSVSRATIFAHALIAGKPDAPCAKACFY